MVLGFRAISRAGAKMAEDQKAREQRATSARATVVAIEKSGSQVRNATVTMKIRLRLEEGDKREVWGFWEVELAHVPAVQPGAKMTVRVDADNPKVCFPTIPGVEHSLMVERMDKQQV